MVALLIETDMEVLNHSSLVVPKALYHFISDDLNKDYASLELKSGLNEGPKSTRWMMLNHHCSGYEEEIITDSMCPKDATLCCQIMDPCKGSIVMVTNYVVL